VTFDVLFAGIPVSDFDGAVAWYERCWGRPADVDVNDDEVMWKVTDTAWVYVILAEPRAGKALLAIAVPDLDALIAELGQRGIGAAPIEQVGDGGRKATVTDLEGNQIDFIEVANRNE
jgi:predicted enzyme related to lactoylglutathione lyase